jgi:hypothetical protein
MSASNTEGALNDYHNYDKFKKFEIESILRDMDEISEEKRLEVYFKDNLNSMLESIAHTRKIVLDRKSEVEELKELLKEKSEETKKEVKNAERATSRKKDALQKAEQARKELEVTKMAMENITIATRDLSQDEANIAKESLRPSLVKKTTIFEKAETELKAAEQLEMITTEKARKLENEFTQLEETYSIKMEEANSLASNTATTINHVVTSFGELVDVAKNLLESSITIDRIPEDVRSSTESNNIGFGEKMVA